MTTPDFPLWSGLFATQLRRLRTATGATLHQFEALCADCIPRHRLAPQDDHAHSRNRCWNLRLVFWTFFWQVAQAGSSCREAIRQAQTLCRLSHQTIPPDETSPYCQARAKLPMERLEQIQHDLVTDAEQTMAARDLWCDHRVQVVDASTVTVPDTPANQQAWPQQSVQKPGCGFPIVRLVGLFSLATGLFTAWVTGSWLQHELVLLQQLWDYLSVGDVLLGDRGFSGWAVLAQCHVRRVHAVFRVHGARTIDWRRGKRLGRDERLVCWVKPKRCPKYLSAEQWALLPSALDLRLVRFHICAKGFRTHTVILVTTLLDPHRYPVAALARLYRRRWDMELSLRHLKTTLQMEHLSCKNPDTVVRELWMHLLVHNVVRRLMCEAARRGRVRLDRVSFAGALAAARRYGEALLQARSRRQRRELLADMYRVLASDLVPDRPGRREPRARKRRPKPYPLLTCHRSRFREIPHQNRYWKGSPYHPKSRQNKGA